jgi:hypothetical protein
MTVCCGCKCELRVGIELEDMASSSGLCGPSLALRLCSVFADSGGGGGRQAAALKGHECC